MNDAIRNLYEVIVLRRASADEGSYTGYLFREGIDKILKKLGEESSETIIAAKSLEAASIADVDATMVSDAVESRRSDLKNEIADLIYHLLVLMVERGVTLDEIEDILAIRAQKTGNLKPIKATDKNT
jgi:phosphoribosyl-ATP pyrophosphohydrolase